MIDPPPELEARAPSSMARLRCVPLYLWLIFALPAVIVLGHAVAPGASVLKGQDWGILLGLGLTIAAAAVFPFYRQRPKWDALPTLTFILMGVAWLYQVVRIQADSSLFNLTAFVVPVALILVGLKRFSAIDGQMAMLVLAYSILGVSLVSLALGQAGLIPSGFDVSDAGPQRFALLDALGAHQRWGGPFGSVNLATPAGGLVLVYGLFQPWRHRTALVVGGGLILFLGGARTSILATLFGCLIFLLWSPVVQRMHHRVALRATALAVSLAATSAYVVVVDPTLNGRLPIWRAFEPLAFTSPVFGVGTSGLLDFVRDPSATPGVLMHDHAHSVLFDMFIRYGAVMLVLSVAILVLTLIAALRSASRGTPCALAILAFVFVSGLAETTYSWVYWSIYFASLVWIATTGSERVAPQGPEDSQCANSR